MKRRLLNLLSLLSLLLCVATIVLWVRSCWVWDQISWQGQRGFDVLVIEMFSDSGAADFVINTVKFPADLPGTAAEWMGPRYWSPGWHGATDQATGEWRTGLWPKWDSMSDPGGRGLTAREYRSLLVPYWLPTVLAAVLPACRAPRLIRNRRRRRQHRCVQCGYDLRATPDRCPECGSYLAADGRAAARMPP